MYLTWRERLDAQPELRNIECWPPSEPQAVVDKSAQQIMLLRQRICAQAVQGRPFEEIAAENGISASYVGKILKRALAGDSNSPPALTRSFIPYRHIKTNTRKEGLDTAAAPRYLKGSFTCLLSQVPGLRDHLDEMIIADIRDSKYGQNTKPVAFHKEMLKYLGDQQWPASRYPFTTMRKGSESSRRYIRRRKDELTLARPQRPALKHKVDFALYCSELHIDSQTLDQHCTLQLDLGRGRIPLRIARPTLLVAECNSTTATLAHHLVLSGDIVAEDIMILIHKMRFPWSPMPINNSDFQYSPDAGFPSGLGGIAHRVPFGIVRLDNALANHAEIVKNAFCGPGSGCVLHYGIPGIPRPRHGVEHKFDITSRVMWRFKSTTGSHPYDPLKESSQNSKKPPVLILQDLFEGLEMTFADENAKPMARLGSSSPLETIRHQLANCYLPMNSPFEAQVSPVHLYTTRPVMVIDGDRPHVNFEYLRYSGPCLHDATLVGKTLRLRYSALDIRTIAAFTVDGLYLGDLSAPGSWMDFPHDVAMRKEMFTLTREKRLKRGDVWGLVFASMLKRRDEPSVALDIARYIQMICTEGRPDDQIKKLLKKSEVFSEDPIESMLKIEMPLHVSAQLAQTTSDKYYTEGQVNRS